MEYSKKWTCTDPDIQQYGRQLAERIFEFRDENTEETEINLDEYDEEYIESTINSYGYTLDESNKSQQFIKDEYPDDWEWVIAECIFECEIY